jgi:predicted AlkP superfamily phosphohydrolase/phosphomutase
MMSDIGKKAVVFWLNGASLADIRSIAEVQEIVQQGVTTELISAPITNSHAHYYQLMTGRHPACFGFFDTQVVRGYSVVKELAGRDRPPATISDQLNGWESSCNEVTPSELTTSIQQWAQDVTSAPALLIVKCVINTSITEDIAAHIGEALHQARSAIGANGLLAIISDEHAAPVKQFVNINNFLAEMGVIERKQSDGSIDWSNTLAYHMGHGQIWVNLLGREIQGVVNHQSEYEEVRATLIEGLPQKLCDSQTGKPVIECVYRKEELYQGDYLFCAPDLVAVFKPGYAPSVQSTRLAFDKTSLTQSDHDTRVIDGAHPDTVKGFLIAIAPELARGVTLTEPAPLTAVAPTLLHALVAKHGPMDSVALQAFFDPAYLEQHPISTHSQQQGLSDEEEELVINRLRDLGYI